MMDCCCIASNDDKCQILVYINLSRSVVFHNQYHMLLTMVDDLKFNYKGVWGYYDLCGLYLYRVCGCHRLFPLAHSLRCVGAIHWWGRLPFWHCHWTYSLPRFVIGLGYKVFLLLQSWTHLGQFMFFKLKGRFMSHLIVNFRPIMQGSIQNRHAGAHLGD